MLFIFCKYIVKQFKNVGQFYYILGRDFIFLFYGVYGEGMGSKKICFIEQEIFGNN